MIVQENMVGKKQYSNKVDKSWVFTYYSKRGYNCTYPHTFNGKKVLCFNEEHRPIGEGGVDLIEQLREEIDNGIFPPPCSKKKISPQKKISLFE